MVGEFTEFGGIRFRKNEVESYSHSKKNGKTEFTVKLKTGQTLIFGDQYDYTGQKQPAVYAHNEHGRPYFIGQDLTGVNIIGNPNKRDYIELKGTSIANSVFTNNDELSDDVNIYVNYVHNANGNKVDVNSSNFLYLGKEDNQIK